MISDNNKTDFNPLYDQAFIRDRLPIFQAAWAEASITRHDNYCREVGDNVFGWRVTVKRTRSMELIGEADIAVNGTLDNILDQRVWVAPA